MRRKTRGIEAMKQPRWTTPGDPELMWTRRIMK
jgi:hypothetical protein